MTERSLAHGSFTVTRHYPASPARVFEAFANPAIKGKWFGDPEKESQASVFEFRNGGREYRSGQVGTDISYGIDIRYYDIVEDARIVYAYEVEINGARTSVSIAAVELHSEAGGTLLRVTEHGAFLDGLDQPGERQGGTEFTLDRLGALLAARS